MPPDARARVTAVCAAGLDLADAEAARAEAREMAETVMPFFNSGQVGTLAGEKQVRLGYRKELEAAPEAEREALFQRLLQQAIDRGQALNMASHLEIDDVIDPADTRNWLQRVLAVACATPLPPRRPFIDAW